jgi:hypothetical protein
MDTYSFGMIIWELWHMSIPFDNDIKSAEEYVVKEESRPKIIRGVEDIDLDLAVNQKEVNDEMFFTAKSRDDDTLPLTKPDYKGTFCDQIICGMIRRCWSQNPEERPNFYEICSILSKNI